MATSPSPPLSCWWRVHQPGSSLAVFHRLDLVSAGPTLTTKSSWQVKLNSPENDQLAKNTYYLGGHDGSYSDDILEFDSLTGQWELVVRMIQARNSHAVSVVDFNEVAGICNWGADIAAWMSILIYYSHIVVQCAVLSWCFAPGLFV